MVKRLVAALGGALLFFAGHARADTVVVPPASDGTLYENDGARADGAGQHLFTGATNDGFKRRAVLRFDVAAAVPAGSMVTTATLKLYMSKTRTTNATVSVHRLTASFTEGTTVGKGEEGNGAFASSPDVTWTYRSWSSLPWTNPGGEFVATASATTTVTDAIGFYAWTSAALNGDVQGWLDNPATNYGWIVIGNEIGNRVADRFDSRQHADTTVHPALEIVFNPPAGVTGACCADDGSCGVVLDPGTSCTGSYQGGKTSCLPNPCPQPIGACCLPSAAATCVTATQADCTSLNGFFQSVGSACSSTTCPVTLTPFVDPLPRPAIAQPITGTSGGTASYRMAIVEISQKLHRDLPDTRVWGFDDGVTGGTYPGPTIEATQGQPVTVTWVNDLRDTSGNLRTTHYLPVDPCPHGVTDASPRTVIHLHGGHVPPQSDGYPESTFLPGAQAVYDYPNAQLPTALWYHDHAVGITRLNLYMGLAGMYVIRNAAENALGLPSGEFEVPLVIQDRSLAADGSLQYPAMLMDMFLGNTIVVNGKVWPYLDVQRGKYRFRVLNGSNTRTYTLALSNGDPIQQIGTDGGLLEAPLSVSSVTLAPGERADLVVDFSSYAAGTKITLRNSAPAPFPSDPGVGVVPDVMQFVVGSQTGFTAPLPASLTTLERMDPAQAVETRDLVLDRVSDACGGTAWMINGMHWSDVTERPLVGTSEVWRFINRSGMMHPMHIHLVMFQIIDRQPFVLVNGVPSPSGPAVPASGADLGLKDTVQVGALEMVRVIARFSDYAGKYVYHCHILEHEDNEMMRQFETVLADAGLPDGSADGSAGSSGASGSGGSPDGGVTGGASGSGGHRAATSSDEGGCGCRVKGRISGPPAAWGSLLALIAVARFRRRLPHELRQRTSARRQLSR